MYTHINSCVFKQDPTCTTLQLSERYCFLLGVNCWTESCNINPHVVHYRFRKWVTSDDTTSNRETQGPQGWSLDRSTSHFKIIIPLLEVPGSAFKHDKTSTITGKTQSLSLRVKTGHIYTSYLLIFSFSWGARQLLSLNNNTNFM